MKPRRPPHYHHEKPANPTCTDLIDVFEDAWNGCVLDQAETLQQPVLDLLHEHAAR